MVGLYCRVSTQEQATEGYSIGEQQERLRSFAASFGWKDVKLYVDPGFSGASLDRPAMQELIRDVKKRKVNRVIVYRLDRLSRSQKDTLYLIEDVFLANGCEFLSMSESFSTETPVGRATIGLLAVFAQLERETIKERMTIGRVARAKAGFYIGSSSVPAGYRYIDGRLVVDDYAASQVRELFRLYLSGKSPRQILDIFTERGYLVDGRPWTRSRLRTVLVNTIYIGRVSFDGVEFDGCHEPIIPKDEFDAAQALIAARAAAFKNNRDAQRSSGHLLTGLVFCSRCGGRMTTQCTHSSGAGRPMLRYYICKNVKEKADARAHGVSCDAPSIRREKLEGLVLDEIRKLALDPSYLEQRKEHKKKEPSESAEIRRQIGRLDGQISRLIDLYASGAFDVDALDEKTSRLRQTRQKLENRLKILEAENPASLIENAQKSLSGFADVVERADVDQLKMIIRALIDRIDVDEDEVLIHWKFD